MRHLGDRLRLPRSRARRLHGRDRARGRRRRRRRGQGRRARRRARRRSSSPGCPSCSAALATGRLRFTTDIAEAAGADVHFVVRRHAAAQRRVRRRPHLRRRRGRRARSRTSPTATSSSASRPCRSAPRRGSPALRGRGARRRDAGVEPRVPARGLRRQGHPAPRPPRLRRARRRRGRGSRAARRGLRHRRSATAPRWSSPTSRPPSWSRSPPTRSSPPRSRSSTRWPSSCEATGADVTQLADAIGYDDAHRPQVPQRRPRLRRRLPAQGHPRLHGPGERARRRPGADASCARSTRSTCAAASGWSTSPARSCGGSIVGTHRRAGRGVQAQQRRRPRLAGAQRRRPDARCRARTSTVTDPRGDRERPPSAGPTSRFADTAEEAAARAPTWCCCSPSGASTATSTPTALGELVAERAIVDGRNGLDPARLARRRLDLPRPRPAVSRGAEPHAPPPPPPGARLDVSRAGGRRDARVRP